MCSDHLDGLGGGGGWGVSKTRKEETSMRLFVMTESLSSVL